MSDYRRPIAFILAVLVTCLLSWLAGFDFDQRGQTAVFIAVVSLAAGGLAASFPFSERNP